MRRSQVTVLVLVLAVLVTLVRAAKKETEAGDRKPASSRGNIFVKKGEPFVMTADGPLRGKILTSIMDSEKSYFAFRGIRFSKPVKRFQPPENPDAWTEVQNATEFGAKCPQVELMSGKVELSSEDCLFLNVYVPASALRDNVQLPVMFWIHGGGFLDGAGSLFGADYFMEKPVILVTVNYRLGLLGFLNVEGIVPGNNGLRDIIHGLKWVQRNIARFYGNPQRVVVFGESAGGCATHLVAISPAAKGLFHGAIAQSGNSGCSWCISPPVDRQKDVVYPILSSRTKCPITDLECLQAADLSIILNTLAEVSFKKGYLDLVVGPSIENPDSMSKGVDPVIPASPRELIMGQNDTKSQPPIIMGVNQEEGLLNTIGFLTNDTEIRYLNDHWHDFAPTAFGYQTVVPQDKIREVSDQLRRFYFGGRIVSGGIPEISRRNIGNLTALFSDLHFNRGTILSTRWHTDRGHDLYLYRLRFLGDFSIAHLLGFQAQAPSHADDLQYLFPSLKEPKNWPDLKKGSKEQTFSRQLIQLWTSFAKDLKPKAGNENEDTDLWTRVPKFSPEDKQENSTSTSSVLWLVLDEELEMDESSEVSSRIRFLDQLLEPYENAKRFESLQSGKYGSKTEL